MRGDERANPISTYTFSCSPPAAVRVVRSSNLVRPTLESKKNEPKALQHSLNFILYFFFNPGPEAGL
jgi:hypothetical protein